MTKTNFKPRYQKVYQSTFDTLINMKLKDIPISLDQIINLSRNIKLCSYSKFINGKDITLQQAVVFFESNLGACAVSSDRTKAIIYYNDTIKNKGLERFTIAHELGHFILGHFDLIDSNNLHRGRLTNDEYTAFEKEANCFARNLLSPIYLLHSIGIAPVDINQLMFTFDISKTAAQTRCDTYKYDLNWLSANYHNALNIQFESSIHYYIFLKECTICRHVFSSKKSAFCPICSSSKIKKFSNYKGYSMIYTEIKTDSHHRVLECLRCKNTDIASEGTFCKICGERLINTCPSPDCALDSLDGNARYCHQCGGQTSFFQNGLLRAWNNPELSPNDFETLDDDDDLPF